MERYLEVKWRDAAFGSSWETDNFVSPPIVTSRGWLAKEGIDYIVLCGTRCDEGGTTWGQTITIPSGMIVSMEDFNG